jgi:elongation factor P--beta-lysine ligase
MNRLSTADKNWRKITHGKMDRSDLKQMLTISKIEYNLEKCKPVYLLSQPRLKLKLTNVTDHNHLLSILDTQLSY